MTIPENEVYTYNYNQIAQVTTEIDYTQLKDNSYNSLNNNYNLQLTDNYNKQDSNFYVNKNIQKNIDSNTINGVNLETLKTQKGTLVFLNTFNSIGRLFKTTSKPIYASGYYLGKDIEITIEVLDNVEKTRKISVVFL